MRLPHRIIALALALNWVYDRRVEGIGYTSEPNGHADPKQIKKMARTKNNASLIPIWRKPKPVTEEAKMAVIINDPLLAYSSGSFLDDDFYGALLDNGVEIWMSLADGLEQKKSRLDIRLDKINIVPLSSQQLAQQAALHNLFDGQYKVLNCFTRKQLEIDAQELKNLFDEGFSSITKNPFIIEPEDLKTVDQKNLELIVRSFRGRENIGVFLPFSGFPNAVSYLDKLLKTVRSCRFLQLDEFTSEVKMVLEEYSDCFQEIVDLTVSYQVYKQADFRTYFTSCCKVQRLTIIANETSKNKTLVLNDFHSTQITGLQLIGFDLTEAGLIATKKCFPNLIDLKLKNCRQPEDKEIFTEQVTCFEALRYLELGDKSFLTNLEFDRILTKSINLEHFSTSDDVNFKILNCTVEEYNLAKLTTLRIGQNFWPYKILIFSILAGAPNIEYLHFTCFGKRKTHQSIPLFLPRLRLCHFNFRAKTQDDVQTVYATLLHIVSIAPTLQHLVIHIEQFPDQNEQDLLPPLPLGKIKSLKLSVADLPNKKQIQELIAAAAADANNLEFLQLINWNISRKSKLITSPLLVKNIKTLCLYKSTVEDYFLFDFLKGFGCLRHFVLGERSVAKTTAPLKVDDSSLPELRWVQCNSNTNDIQSSMLTILSWAPNVEVIRVQKDFLVNLSDEQLAVVDRLSLQSVSEFHVYDSGCVNSQHTARFLARLTSLQSFKWRKIDDDIHQKHTGNILGAIISTQLRELVFFVKDWKKTSLSGLSDSISKQLLSFLERQPFIKSLDISFDAKSSVYPFETQSHIPACKWLQKIDVWPLKITDKGFYNLCRLAPGLRLLDLKFSEGINIELVLQNLKLLAYLKIIFLRFENHYEEIVNLIRSHYPHLETEKNTTQVAPLEQKVSSEIILKLQQFVEDKTGKWTDQFCRLKSDLKPGAVIKPISSVRRGNDLRQNAHGLPYVQGFFTFNTLEEWQVFISLSPNEELVAIESVYPVEVGRSELSDPHSVSDNFYYVRLKDRHGLGQMLPIGGLLEAKHIETFYEPQPRDDQIVTTIALIQRTVESVRPDNFLNAINNAMVPLNFSPKQWLDVFIYYCRWDKTERLEDNFPDWLFTVTKLRTGSCITRTKVFEALVNHCSDILGLCCFKSWNGEHMFAELQATGCGVIPGTQLKHLLVDLGGSPVIIKRSPIPHPKFTLNPEEEKNTLLSKPSKKQEVFEAKNMDDFCFHFFQRLDQRTRRRPHKRNGLFIIKDTQDILAFMFALERWVLAMKMAFFETDDLENISEQALHQFFDDMSSQAKNNSDIMGIWCIYWKASNLVGNNVIIDEIRHYGKKIPENVLVLVIVSWQEYQECFGEDFKSRFICEGMIPTDLKFEKDIFNGCYFKEIPQGKKVKSVYFYHDNNWQGDLEQAFSEEIDGETKKEKMAYDGLEMINAPWNNHKFKQSCAVLLKKSNFKFIVETTHEVQFEPIYTIETLAADNFSDCVVTLNTTVYDNFFEQWCYTESKPRPGWFSIYAGSNPFTILVTGALSEGQWERFLKKFATVAPKTKLRFVFTPGVTIPPYLAAPLKEIKHSPLRSISELHEINSEIFNKNCMMVVISTDFNKTEHRLIKLFSLDKVLSVGPSLQYSDLIEFVDPSEKGFKVITASLAALLLQGKTVAIKVICRLSENLADYLTSLGLSKQFLLIDGERKPIPAGAKLIIITDDSSLFPYVPHFRDSEQNTLDENPATATEEKIIPSSPNENKKSKSSKHKNMAPEIADRLRKVASLLDTSSCISVQGPEECGKTVTIKCDFPAYHQLTRHRSVKIFYGREKTMEWAQYRDSSYAILFVDNAQFEAESDIVAFSGLENTTPGILMPPHFKEVTKKHKVIFAFVPNDKICNFLKQLPTVVFQPLSKEFLSSDVVHPTLTTLFKLCDKSILYALLWFHDQVNKIAPESLAARSLVMICFRFFRLKDEYKKARSNLFEIYFFTIACLDELRYLHARGLDNDKKQAMVVCTLKRCQISENKYKDLIDILEKDACDKLHDYLPRSFFVKSRYPIIRECVDQLWIRDNIRLKHPELAHTGKRAILLQGTSGIGKSSIFSHCFTAWNKRKSSTAFHFLTPWNKRKENVETLLQFTPTDYIKLKSWLGEIARGLLGLMDEANSCGSTEKQTMPVLSGINLEHEGGLLAMTGNPGTYKNRFQLSWSLISLLSFITVVTYPREDLIIILREIFEYVFRSMGIDPNKAKVNIDVKVTKLVDDHEAKCRYAEQEETVMPTPRELFNDASWVAEQEASNFLLPKGSAVAISIHSSIISVIKPKPIAPAKENLEDTFLLQALT